MWRTFCLIFLGANVASAALLRHDHKVSRADGKVQEKDLLDMLTSLNEVVVGMDKEHKAFRDLSNARETSCRTTKAKLEKSLKDGNSSLLTAKQELSNAMSEVDSIQGGVDSIKKQVKAIDGEISGLQEQLAKLRADRQAAVARDSGYTQQVKAILEKAQQRISQVWTRSGAHKSAKSQEEESEVSGQDEKGEVPSASARPPLPGFSAKTERWVMELVYGRRCEAEEKYLKERRLNVPVTKVPLYKSLGFRAIKHPSYIEVRPATPSMASKASKASRLSGASGASRSCASLGRRICSQPILVPIEEPAEVLEEEEVPNDQAEVPQQTSSGFVMPKYAHAKYSMRHMYLAECGARNNSMRNVRNVIKPLPNARAAGGAKTQSEVGR